MLWQVGRTTHTGEGPLQLRAGVRRVLLQPERPAAPNGGQHRRTNSACGQWLVRQPIFRSSSSHCWRWQHSMARWRKPLWRTEVSESPRDSAWVVAMARSRPVRACGSLPHAESAVRPSSWGCCVRRTPAHQTFGAGLCSVLLRSTHNTTKPTAAAARHRLCTQCQHPWARSEPQVATVAAGQLFPGPIQCCSIQSPVAAAQQPAMPCMGGLEEAFAC